MLPVHLVLRDSVRAVEADDQAAGSGSQREIKEDE